MVDTHAETLGKRSIWLRGLLMILMAMAFQVSGTLLALGAIIQFVLALLNNAPNARLIAFWPKPGALPEPDFGLCELCDGGSAISVQRLAD